MSHVERGRPFLGGEVARILRKCLQDHAAAGGDTAGQRAGVVNGLRKCVARLKAEADAGLILSNAGLQRVICRMRSVGHDRLRAKSSGGMACGIEVRERSESRVRAV